MEPHNSSSPMSALTSTECNVRFWPHLSWLVTGAEVLRSLWSRRLLIRGVRWRCAGADTRASTGLHSEAAGPGPGQWRMRHQTGTLLPPNLRPILLLQIQPDSSLSIMWAGVLPHTPHLTLSCYPATRGHSVSSQQVITHHTPHSAFSKSETRL